MPIKTAGTFHENLYDICIRVSSSILPSSCYLTSPDPFGKVNIFSFSISILATALPKSAQSKNFEFENDIFNNAFYTKFHPIF